MMPLCVHVLVFLPFLTRVFGNRSDGGSGYHPNKSEVEQHGDGITLPYIQRGRIPLFFWPFFTLNGHFLVFFTCFVTAILCIIFVNPNRAESEHFSGKLRRKKRGSSFSLTPPLQPCSLLSYLSVAESPWLIIIGRCHHADDTQSAL